MQAYIDFPVMELRTTVLPITLNKLSVLPMPKAHLEGGDLIDLDPSLSPVAVGTVEFLTVIPD